MISVKTDLKPVVSTNIAAIGHDGDNLIVRFRSGTSYRYQDVPACVYDALLTAKSVGAHFHKTVKGKFSHTKL